MKILHIDTGKEFRGGQRQVQILHNGLLEKGYESYLLANESGKLLDNKNTIPFKYNSELSIETHKNFFEIVKKIKPDVVHTHDGHGPLFASLCKNKFGYKIIETRRVSYPISFLSRFLKYKNVDKHVAVSQDTANYLLKYFDDVSVIHSCIELDRFNIEKKDVLEKKNKYNILFVGAFSSQKGIDILIKAFNKINRENVSLHLVGDGELLNDMKKISSSNTIFYGRRDDVEKFYLNADCIVVPSVDGEGSSGVIKEGIVAHKVVIASDLEANKELINDNINGVMFKSADISDLQIKLEAFLDNKINISQDEIMKSAKEFDCKFLIDQYINIYNNL